VHAERSFAGRRDGAERSAGLTNGSAPDELIPLKVLIAGGFGVGKTTLVRSLSEIPPLLTEQAMTAASIGIDEAGAVPEKSTTTVAMDFGRLSVDDSLILYLFGTPGQSRFWFMWDELARGSVGAVVLVDLRRVDDCFPAIDYFENRRLPFVIAVNRFPEADDYDAETVRDALALSPDTPVVWMDARDPESSQDALIVLVEHALARSTMAEVG
jgi:signal recognition particle receptor subunit beta